jgi:hypothetical protein
MFNVLLKYRLNNENSVDFLKEMMIKYSGLKITDDYYSGLKITDDYNYELINHSGIYRTLGLK